MLDLVSLTVDHRILSILVREPAKYYLADFSVKEKIRQKTGKLGPKTQIYCFKNNQT